MKDYNEEIREIAHNILSENKNLLKHDSNGGSYAAFCEDLLVIYFRDYIANLLHKQDIESKREQCMRDSLQYSLNTDVDESFIMGIRDVQLDVIEQEIKDWEASKK